MPQLPFTRSHIEMPVADRLPGIKQKARFVRLSHGQAENGQCDATVTVLVTMYRADGEDFGAEVSGPGLSTYLVDLTADNNCLVEVDTGAVLARRNGANSVDWQATIDSFPQETLLQGDYFEYLREEVDVRIGDLIRLHITQADAAPSRFA